MRERREQKGAANTESLGMFSRDESRQETANNTERLVNRTQFEMPTLISLLFRPSPTARGDRVARRGAKI